LWPVIEFSVHTEGKNMVIKSIPSFTIQEIETFQKGTFDVRVKKKTFKLISCPLRILVNLSKNFVCIAFSGYKNVLELDLR
jgi:hypothetical protein